ncbi:hybrid sensor histidine kinase/response regulator [Calothrix sp. PCC 6303]|uniref:hybrid sensor histidine kinase/response regulator n=1 Tax=Calothrix sp. PCC 6303 TaxID=1170562 RepID=UPI0002A0593A|nr:hybrid sensor histidine kinase/response regulator [Calothrix sp. PCC 6303]AFZ00037.1 CheA signal transduction histidine kinase [Calothrix sp. PCC 6303]
MITDSSIREQGYIYFLTEAPELLHIIEEELFSLVENCSTAKVHNLMRATHTIKGGAANVGLETINKIAHSLEDIFKALYNPDIQIDTELHTLLFQAFECLQLPVTAEITKTKIDDHEVLQRAASVFAMLQTKLGDAFGAETYIPTSEELGFDIVLSIFETGVSQRIDSIAEIIQTSPAPEQLAEFMRSQAEVFLGLAESLNLPGFCEIAESIQSAITAKPLQSLEIAKLALADLQAARTDIMEGDRTRGGTPSPQLKQFAQNQPIVEVETHNTSNNYQYSLENNLQESSSLRDKIVKLYDYLIQPSTTDNESLKPIVAKFYLKIIRYLLGWFNHELNIPEKELDLILLIPKELTEESLEYIDSWLSDFFTFLEDAGDSTSLNIYRQGVIINVLLVVARFNHYQNTLNDDLITQWLQNQINRLVQDYKRFRPVSPEEKNWVDSPKLLKLLEIKEISPPPNSGSDDMELIWGEELISEPDITEEPNISTEDAPYNLDVHEDEILTEDTNTSLQVTDEASVQLVTEPVVEIYPENIPQPKKSENIQQNSNSPKQQTFVRVDVDGLQRLNYLAGELLIYQKRRTLYDEQLKKLIGQLSEQLSNHQGTLNYLRELPLQIQSFKSAHKNSVQSVDFDVLEMDDYTEFHLSAHSALEEILQLQETIESLDVIADQSNQIHDKQQRLSLGIIDHLVEARMAPLGNILNRFPQMVQNLGNLHKKSVEMELSGTQVLVDKAISEKLYDPLLHLVRNAFDHGIETSELRRDRGKSEKGTIKIRAYHQGSQTIIEVSDDGQGLNFARIHQKGVELGLIPNTDVYSNFASREEELLDLLFSPGFSTAGKVSEISGRGIGLDIVKTQLKSLNGSITVNSVPDQGTTFILKIPFSMTTEQLMIVQADGVVYALLLDSIEKILLSFPEQIKEFEGRKALFWNDGKENSMVALRNLSEFMNYNCAFTNSASISSKTMMQDSGEMVNPILMLRRNHEIMAIEVDQIIGEQELVIRPLGNAIAPPKYVYGCTSLANGNLVLVIDGSLLLETQGMQAKLDKMALSGSSLNKTKSLASAAMPLLPASSVESESNHFAKSSRTILVVDDAISLRQTISLTLQKAGYTILQAQNGVEALEQLQRHPEVKLIVSDLEMPRMNGFELLSNIRQHPSICQKPVVVLTSRSSEKHRKLAEALGANAYMTKPYLENEFLSTVDGLTKNSIDGLTHVFVKS